MREKVAGKGLAESSDRHCLGLVDRRRAMLAVVVVVAVAGLLLSLKKMK